MLRTVVFAAYTKSGLAFCLGALAALSDLPSKPLLRVRRFAGSGLGNLVVLLLRHRREGWGRGMWGHETGVVDQQVFNPLFRVVTSSQRPRFTATCFHTLCPCGDPFAEARYYVRVVRAVESSSKHAKLDVAPLACADEDEGPPIFLMSGTNVNTGREPAVSAWTSDPRPPYPHYGEAVQWVTQGGDSMPEDEFVAWTSFEATGDDSPLQRGLRGHDPLGERAPSLYTADDETTLVVDGLQKRHGDVLENTTRVSLWETRYRDSGEVVDDIDESAAAYAANLGYLHVWRALSREEPPEDLCCGGTSASVLMQRCRGGDLRQ